MKILLLIVGQYGFGDIAKRISTMRVFPPGSGPDGNPSKTGYGPSPFSRDALTFFSAENLVHPVNSGSRGSWFGIHNLKHPFRLPVTKGGKGGTMAQ